MQYADLDRPLGLGGCAKRSARDKRCGERRVPDSAQHLRASLSNVPVVSIAVGARSRPRLLQRRGGSGRRPDRAFSCPNFEQRLPDAWRDARHDIFIGRFKSRITMTDHDAVLAANLEFYRAFAMRDLDAM